MKGFDELVRNVRIYPFWPEIFFRAFLPRLPDVPKGSVWVFEEYKLAKTAFENILILYPPDPTQGTALATFPYARKGYLALLWSKERDNSYSAAVHQSIVLQQGELLQDSMLTHIITTQLKHRYVLIAMKGDFHAKKTERNNKKG